MKVSLKLFVCKIDFCKILIYYGRSWNAPIVPAVMDM